MIAISHSTARDLAATFDIPADQIDVAVPGVDPRFKPLPPAEVADFRVRAGLPERFLLFVGTLEPRKNLPVLLRAYAHCRLRTGRRCRWCWPGAKAGCSTTSSAPSRKHDLGDSVILPGYVSADDLPLWYNAAETLVYPSVFEGFGLPVVEALACGTPALVSDVSSLPEAAGDGGLRLPPDDVAAWTGALRRAMHDAAWRADAGAARAAPRGDIHLGTYRRADGRQLPPRAGP